MYIQVYLLVLEFIWNLTSTFPALFDNFNFSPQFYFFCLLSYLRHHFCLNNCDILFNRY